jgi:predicted TIM-barrel fold metal-dependent hydrolase
MARKGNDRGELADELFGELEQVPTIDAHEHLVPEAEHCQWEMDFFSLFEHYCPSDLVAAGASEQQMAEFSDRSLPEEERWRKFKPFLERIRSGSYARAALGAMRGLLGVEELTDETYEAVGEKLRELNRPGLYEHVLRERCNLASCVQCVHLKDMGPEWFVHLAPAGDLVDLAGAKDRERTEAMLGRPVGGLDDVLDCMDKALADWAANPRIVGIKLGHAYTRSLAFRKTPRSEARRALRRILSARRQAARQDALRLQDFLVYRLAERAGEVGLPLVIHTGLQAGNFHRIADADPLHLHELIDANRGTRFDLFHGGMPWVREIAVLAKHFPNVYLNMAWMHVISPAQSRSALSEWLDMVPHNKIFGFGGDYSIVEKVYGHLQMARRNIARVLADKVEEDAWPRALASAVGRRLMLENPAEFYGIAIR